MYGSGGERRRKEDKDDLGPPAYQGSQEGGSLRRPLSRAFGKSFRVFFSLERVLFVLPLFEREFLIPWSSRFFFISYDDSLAFVSGFLS